MATGDEIRKHTSAILDKADAEEYVAQITDASVEEMIAANPEEPVVQQDANAPTNVYYGHDMRYDGEFYIFRADIPGSPCGMTWWKLPQRAWNHEFQSRRCGNHNNMAVLKFTRR